MKWQKVRANHARAESILTRFQDRVKPLKEQLEAEVKRLQAQLAAKEEQK